MKRITAIASTITLAGAGILASVAPAQAYSFEWDNAAPEVPANTSYCGETTGSEFCWDSNGDRIYVKDTKADGYSAVARWYTDYGRWGTCRNSLGAGQWGVCNKDFAEGYVINMRASRYDGDTGQYVGPESPLYSFYI
jgi:hypothetical protein